MPELSPTQLRVLGQLVDEAMDALGDRELEQAEATAAEAVAMAPERPEVLRLQAELAWAHERDEEARALLERALSAGPGDADAHHLLARVHEALGHREAMIEHDLRVLAMDGNTDLRAGIGTRDDLRFIEACAREVLDTLPRHLGERLAEIPVMLEPRPGEALVREGFDPRALGLFEGATHGTRRQIGAIESGGVDLQSTRIVLYYGPLLAACRDDEELAEQIEVTILHEIGHFFDLDEDEVAALGLK